LGSDLSNQSLVIVCYCSCADLHWSD